MNEQVVNVLLSVLAAVIAAGAAVGIYYIKQRIGDKRWEQIMEWVRIAVDAAEMMGTSLGWDGAEKKQWVLERLAEITKLPPEKLEVLVEDWVKWLKDYGQELEKVNGRIQPRG